MSNRDDFNWEESFVFIQRGVVEGNVDDVKSYYSKAPLPLSPGLVEILKEHRARWEKLGVPWVFHCSQSARPYSMYDVQGDVLDPAGERAGLARDSIGTHSVTRACVDQSDQLRLVGNRKVSNDSFGRSVSRRLELIFRKPCLTTNPESDRGALNEPGRSRFVAAFISGSRGA